jgi:hypothetical protein
VTPTTRKRALAWLSSKGWEVTAEFPSGRIRLRRTGLHPVAWPHGQWYPTVYQCASLEKAARWLGWRP